MLSTAGSGAASARSAASAASWSSARSSSLISSALRIPSPSRRICILAIGSRMRVGLALGGGAVELVVVGERVGVRPHAMAVDKRRSASCAAVRRRLLKRAQAGHGIGAVHLGKVEVGEVGHQPRDVSARRVHFNRNADGVAVVFHAEDHRQLLVRRGVERLPELALRGRALAHARQHHFVAVELHVVKGAIVALSLRRRFGMAAEVAPGLGASHGMQQLRGGRRRRADDVQRAAAPVRGHLAAAAGRIGGRAHGLQHHLVGRDAQRQAQRAIAIVGKEPVVAGTQRQRRAHLQRLVAGARNLEEDLLLPLEKDLAVVHRRERNISR